MIKSQGYLIGTAVGKTLKQIEEAKLFEAELHRELEHIQINSNTDLKSHEINTSNLETTIDNTFNDILTNKTNLNDIKKIIYSKVSDYLIDIKEYIISINELDAFAVLAMYNADKQFPGNKYISSRSELNRFRVYSDINDFDRFLNQNQEFVVEELDENTDIHICRFNFNKKNPTNMNLEEKNPLYCYINNGKIRIEEISKFNPFITFLHDYTAKNFQKLYSISDKENWNRQAIQCLDNALPTYNSDNSSFTNRKNSLFYDAIFSDIKKL